MGKLISIIIIMLSMLVSCGKPPITKCTLETCGKNKTHIENTSYENSNIFSGTGWNAYLKKDWEPLIIISSNRKNNGLELLAKSIDDNLLVIGGIYVKPHKEKCPWNFVKYEFEMLEINNNVNIIDTKQLNIGGMVNLVILYVEEKNIMIQAITATNINGYIIKCGGYTNKPEIVLSRCSDFASSIIYKETTKNNYHYI